MTLTEQLRNLRSIACDILIKACTDTPGGLFTTDSDCFRDKKPGTVIEVSMLTGFNFVRYTKTTGELEEIPIYALPSHTLFRLADMWTVD